MMYPLDDGLSSGKSEALEAPDLPNPKHGGTVMSRATISGATNGHESPQQDQDLLGLVHRWQKSPIGDTAHTIHNVVIGIGDLCRFARQPERLRAIDWEADSLHEAHVALGRLLLAVSAHRADRVAS
jgi:hypothetical protein